jgi:hypothetical protein
LADTKISALVALTGANTASGDLIPIVDVSVPETKSITRDELKTALLAAPGPIGSTTPAAGSFTTLHVPGAGNVATNEAYGTGTLAANTIGFFNTAVGYNALKLNTTGQTNTAVGYQALNSNTTGEGSTAVGVNALYSSTTGTQNTAIGFQPLYNNTTGRYNTALGQSALYANTTGSYNTALGMQALVSNSTGSGNTGINPLDNVGNYLPVFNPITENNRFCCGSTSVTNAYIKVAWTVTSDARDKTNFALVPHGLDFVLGLKPTAYQYRVSRYIDEPDGPVRYGFKAQDVLALEGATPVIVDAEDANHLRFNDQSLLAVLTLSIQELSAKVTLLEGK